MKKKNMFVFVLLCSLFLSIASCGDDGKDNPLNESRTVTVKVTGSANLVISVVAIVTGTGETKTYSEFGEVNTWTKDITYEKAIAVSAGGSTSDGETGSMKIQILEGSKVLKESTSDGKNLTTTASYYND